MKLLSIINEAKQHLDDEIVDFNQIDLRAEFNNLNSQLFGSQIKIVPMRWNTSKSAHGKVRARMTKRGNDIVKIETIDLTLSKFFDIPYKFFKDTLAHEMIHLYLLQQNINDNHGPKFIAEMDRINKMGLGFNINVRNEIPFAVSQQNITKPKDLVFLMFKKSGDQNLNLSVMNYATYKKEGKLISDIFVYNVNKSKYSDVNGEFYRTSSPALLRYSIQRSFSRSLSSTRIDNELFVQLKTGAKLLSKFLVNKNGVSWEGPDLPDEPQKPQNVRTVSIDDILRRLRGQQ